MIIVMQCLAACFAVFLFLVFFVQDFFKSQGFVRGFKVLLSRGRIKDLVLLIALSSVAVLNRFLMMFEDIIFYKQL